MPFIFKVTHDKLQGISWSSRKFQNYQFDTVHLPHGSSFSIQSQKEDTATSGLFSAKTAFQGWPEWCFIRKFGKTHSKKPTVEAFLNWRLGLQFYSKKVSIEGFSLCILRYFSEGFFLYKSSERLLLSLRWKGFLTKPLTWMLLHCAFYSINQFILLSLFKEFDKINGVRKWITLNLGEWIYIFFQVCRKVHSFWDAFLQRNSKGEEM